MKATKTTRTRTTLCIIAAITLGLLIMTLPLAIQSQLPQQLYPENMSGAAISQIRSQFGLRSPQNNWLFLILIIVTSTIAAIAIYAIAKRKVA